MGFESDKRGCPRVVNQAQLEISFLVWAVIQLRELEGSEGSFFALRGAHISNHGMGLEFV
tara:strand:- start:446 stop:625 length:180 start_codon:yes stop_codon:yes gene_type:complete